jgi:hypothetical protein
VRPRPRDNCAVPRDKSSKLSYLSLLVLVIMNSVPRAIGIGPGSSKPD